jgi:hypothetical protein
MTRFQRMQRVRIGVLSNAGEGAHLSGAKATVVGDAIEFERVPGVEFTQVVLDDWPTPTGRARAIPTAKLEAL